MSGQRPPPPSSFPQPYASHWSSNPAQNGASDSARPQDGLPSRHGYPPMHNAAPTYEHASSFHCQPAPPPSGSISHHQSFPERYASINSSRPPLPMMQHAATMPYDMSRHPPSRSEMSGGPQPSSQSWSYLDVNKGESDSSDSSDGDLEQSPEAQNRSPPSVPFAGRKSKSHGRRPQKGSPSGSPCKLCGKLSPPHVIEHWRGFCSETHMTQWRQNVTGNSADLQGGPGPGQVHPSQMPSPTGYPSQQYLSQQYPPQQYPPQQYPPQQYPFQQNSSSQSSSTPSRRSTLATTPTYDHTSLPPHQSVPPHLSGSAPYNPPSQFPVPALTIPVRHLSTNPSGPPPPEPPHRALTMPTVHTASSVPYDMPTPNTMYSSSQPGIVGGPQHTAQGRSHRLFR